MFAEMPDEYPIWLKDLWEQHGEWWMHKCKRIAQVEAMWAVKTDFTNFEPKEGSKLFSF